MTNDTRASLKEELLRLEALKSETEVKVQQALNLLESSSVGLHGRLVDAEGFPLDNVDHYSVRDARHTVACGMNDLKAFDDEIHEKLRLLHELTFTETKEFLEAEDVNQEQRRREAEKRQNRMKLEAEMKRKVPFLETAAVAPGSPAQAAGLHEGDKVVKLGDIDSETFSTGGLRELSQLVQSHQGKIVSVWILRLSRAGDGSTEVYELPLVPQRWTGDGLLGCAFDPLPR